MKLISKLAGRKGWSQPPFWETERSIISPLTGDRESIGVDFEAIVEHAYKASGPVFAAVAARMMVFAQARFLWRRFEDGRPSDLFAGPELSLLERPWEQGTTGGLLARMEQHDSLAGNFYAAKIRDSDGLRLRVLPPDRVVIAVVSRSTGDASRPQGDPWALDAKIGSYLYTPPGRAGDPIVLDPSEVVHYASTPDPIARYRGTSWLTPIIKEVSGDKAATKHKLKFFENGATPSIAISYDKEIDPEAFERFVAEFNKQHAGVDNAYKALHLGGGADPHMLTADFKQLDFKAVQGAGETRILMAAGAHAVIVGASEGMQGSALNAGNFQAARRLFVDKTIRHLWSMASPALESVLKPPSGAHLWYDDRDIPFLRQDAQEEAEIRSTDASTIVGLVTNGFTHESAVRAVTTGDLRQLEHTGLHSVQLHPAGQNGQTEGAAV